MDGVMKLFKPAVVVDATFKVGYAESTIVPLGIVLLACTILYVVPQTSVVGAILLTGYLGGAVATHTRVGDPLFSHVLFPTYLGALIWLGFTCAMRACAPWCLCDNNARRQSSLK